MIQDCSLIIIAGPTSVGKTEVCINLAKHFNTEIVNCDSRQMFREMQIGSGCPSPDQLKIVKHHFIGNLSVHDYYNAGRYETDVMELIESLFHRHSVLILSAGSGMYLDAIMQGIDFMPEYNQEVRDELNQTLKTYGLEYLLNELEKADPVYYREVDKNNIQRVLRGLEVKKLTGIPYSQYRVKQHKVRPFNMVKILLQRNRDELYQRIDKRVDSMLAAGLEQEARNLYGFKQLVPLKTIGYREFFMYFDGIIDRNEAIRLIKRNTRHLARRQLTWFRSKKDFTPIEADNLHEILRYIINSTSNKI